MAEIVDPFNSRRGRPPLHNWKEWADGKPRRLYRGEDRDFTATLISFRQMAHRQARLMDMRVETQINEADQSIKIQFHPRQKKRARGNG